MANARQIDQTGRVHNDQNDYRKPMAIIEIQLNSLPQLFDSLDPAPFREKALDPRAADYLIESVDEYSGRVPVQLCIRGPEALQAKLPEITDAVHSHFRRELEGIEWKLRRKMRLGRVALVIGLAVLAVTLVARYLLEGVGNGGADLIGEGLLIIGWVGLWRPAELLLFERLESRADRAAIQRLSTIPVEFKVLEPVKAE